VKALLTILAAGRCKKKGSIMKKLFIILCSFFVASLFSAHCYGGVIFETNFDNVNSWETNSGTDACWHNTEIEGDTNGCSITPWTKPWTSNAVSIWNDYRHVAPRCSTKPVQHIGTASEINASTGYSVSGYGGSGKSYVHIYEPCQTGSGGWGADGLLGVYFGKTTGYSELYVKMHVRFMPGWTWGSGSTYQKFIHISHFDEYVDGGVLQAYNFFHTYGTPMDVPNQPMLVQESYRNTLYDPNTQFYIGYVTPSAEQLSTSVYPTSGIEISDGSWHEMKWHVKLNTAANASNGIGQLWIDNQLVINWTTAPWTGSNTPSASAYGFNRVIIGGNSYNFWMPGGADPNCMANLSCPTQWYQVDNLVVSTTDIATGYIPSGGSPPSAPTNLSGSVAGGGIIK
jgi:hypothetical protein